MCSESQVTPCTCSYCAALYLEISFTTTIDQKDPPPAKLSLDFLQLGSIQRNLEIFTIRLLVWYHDNALLNESFSRRLPGRIAVSEAEEPSGLPFERPTTPHEGGLKSTKRLRHSQEPTNLTSINDSVLGLGFGYKVQVSNLDQHASRHSGEGQPKINLPRFNGTLKLANDWNVCRPSPARYR